MFYMISYKLSNYCLPQIGCIISQKIRKYILNTGKPFAANWRQQNNIRPFGELCLSDMLIGFGL